MRDVDDREFAQFVDGHARELRRTAYLMCGDWQRAEDATQDALVKLYVAWSRLERSGALRAYAHRAVTTAVIDQGRRPWRREVTGGLPARSGRRPDRARRPPAGRGAGVAVASAPPSPVRGSPLLRGPLGGGDRAASRGHRGDGQEPDRPSAGAGAGLPARPGTRRRAGGTTMNERMSDLLDRASDDGGAPLGFSGDTVVRRAVVRRRRRHGGVAVGLAAAGVVGVVVVTQLAGSSRSDNTRSVVAPSRRLPTAPSSSTAPALSPQEQAIVDRCARAPMPPPPTTISERNPETTVNPGRSRRRPEPNRTPASSRLDPRRACPGCARGDRYVRQPGAHAVGELPAGGRRHRHRRRGRHAGGSP